MTRAIATGPSAVLEAWREHGYGTPLALGFPALDAALGGGLLPGELLVLGGAPGTGKTVLALQSAAAVARRGQPSAYVCYEHAPIELVRRLVASEIGATTGGDASSTLVDAVLRGEERDAGIEAAARSVQELEDLVLVDGSPELDLSAVEAIVKQRKPALLVIDYLQKVPESDEHRGSRQAVRDAVTGSKDLAMRYGMAVVAIASCGDAGLHRQRVRLEHLRGAAVVGHEADVVILLNHKHLAVSEVHRDYDSVRARDHHRWLIASIEKNRRGVPDVDLEFPKDLAHFRLEPVGQPVAETLLD